MASDLCAVQRYLLALSRYGGFHGGSLTFHLPDGSAVERSSDDPIDDVDGFVNMIKEAGIDLLEAASYFNEEVCS